MIFDTPGYVVNTALLGSDVSTYITSEENSGLKAKYNFVVLKHTTQFTPTRKATFALPRTETQAKFALAVWVSSKKSIKPIQSTGAWL